MVSKTDACCTISPLFSFGLECQGQGLGQPICSEVTAKLKTGSMLRCSLSLFYQCLTSTLRGWSLGSHIEDRVRATFMMQHAVASHFSCILRLL